MPKLCFPIVYDSYRRRCMEECDSSRQPESMSFVSMYLRAVLLEGARWSIQRGSRTQLEPAAYLRLSAAHMSWSPLVSPPPSSDLGVGAACGASCDDASGTI